MIRGEGIKRLIPQRYPMMMVDELVAADESTATTTLTVRTDNMFVNADGELAETGLIEHVAQSASALAGYHALGQAAKPPVGIIGEVKRFECSRRAIAGEKLQTTVTFGFSFGAVTIATGVTYAGGERIAETRLKIFIQ